MVLHAIGILAAIGGIVLCTLLPFLPGRYDPIAVTISAMAQVLGYVGLLLVPVGVAWLVSRSRRPATTTIVVGSFVWTIVSLAGLTFSSIALGVSALAVGVFTAVSARRRLTIISPRGARSLGWCLVIVPIAALVIQRTIAGPAESFSRARAIQNSAPLIADIEQYRAARGQYPPSMLGVWPDYLPGLIGIKEYRYEPAGDSYNLVFEQFSFTLPTREFVVYNPRDENVMTSHPSDLLQHPPSQLALRRGYYEMLGTQYPHWKIFRFD